MAVVSTAASPTWPLRRLLPLEALMGVEREIPLGGLKPHALRVAGYACAVAERCDLPSAAIRLLRIAAAYHDVGKLQLPPELLSKPGPLTPSERARMEAHTVRGAARLARAARPELRAAATVARHHHENRDGSGYPDGLHGDAIPFPARIVRVVDVFDALTVARPYRGAASEGAALDLLRRGRGTLFDPVVVDALEAALAHAPDLGAQLRRLGADPRIAPRADPREDSGEPVRHPVLFH